MAFTNMLTSLKSAWADWRILLAARDDLDDDYNFASGPRRGAAIAAAHSASLDADAANDDGEKLPAGSSSRGSRDEEARKDAKPAAVVSSATTTASASS